MKTKKIEVETCQYLVKKMRSKCDELLLLVKQLQISKAVKHEYK